MIRRVRLVALTLAFAFVLPVVTALAQELDITMPQLALAWILRRPEISCVITGATRPVHVENNVKAAEIKLDDEVLARIDAIL